MIEKLADRVELMDAALEAHRAARGEEAQGMEEQAIMLTSPIDALIAKMNELVDAVNELQDRVK